MRLIQIVCIGFTLLSSSLYIDGQSSPLGNWRTVNDATGKTESIVTISEENGKLVGTIRKVYDPYPKETQPLCTACQGALKNKPMIGLRILWDMQKDKDEWANGKILDPDTGKIYRCVLSMENNGNRLRVRGFVGMALFGRTQYWIRDK
jgi:uncharacterized protein (DUF2147 family)